ncbi:MAG: hypothetical protein H6737_17785 [Alphaproteobacteria bacterium]|nr:hypothetical protein [Alphaproteobacteria bacterium]
MVIDRRRVEAADARALAREQVLAAKEHGVVVVEGDTRVSILTALPRGEHLGYDIDVDDWSFCLRVVTDASEPAGHRCLVGLAAPIDPATLTLFVSEGVLVATARRAT